MSKSVDILPYPGPDVLLSLDEDVLASALNAWCTLISYYLASKRYPPSLGAFVQTYVRTSCRPTDSSKLAGLKSPQYAKLRRLVFILVTQKGIVTMPSPEFVWDFVTLYGPTNVHHTAAYVAGVYRTSVFASKLTKYALHLVSTHQDPSGVVPVLAVLLSEPTVAASLQTDDWFSSLRSIGSELSTQVTALCRQPSRASVNPEHVHLLTDLFPDLDHKHAEQLLSNGDSVETVSARLLDNPDLLHAPLSSGPRGPSLDEAAKLNKLYQPISSKKGNDTTSNEHQLLETTLRLIYEAEEDERDDTYDDVPQTGQEAASSRALQKTEHDLWNVYTKNPSVFERTSRKTKQRDDIRKSTSWSDEQIEGWARMLERNPRQKALMEERFMFQGNRPHMRNSILAATTPTGELSSVETDGTSDGDDDAPEESAILASSGTSSGPSSGPSSRPSSRPPRRPDNKPAASGSSGTPASGSKPSNPQGKPSSRSSEKAKTIRRAKQKDKHTQKMGL